VRISQSLKDASFVAQLLARAPQVLVASPAYLERHGTPKTVGELANHNCLVHSLKAPTSIWSFRGPEGKVSVRVRGALRSNFGDALRYAALLGHGISMHPTYMIADDLAAGTLKVLMPEYEPTRLEVYAVFPSRRNVPLRVNTFLTFLREWFSARSNWPVAASRPGSSHLLPAADRHDRLRAA